MGNLTWLCSLNGSSPYRFLLPKTVAQKNTALLSVQMSYLDIFSPYGPFTQFHPQYQHFPLCLQRMIVPTPNFTAGSCSGFARSCTAPCGGNSQAGRNTDPILTETVQSLYCHPLAFWITMLIGPPANLNKWTKTKDSTVPCNSRALSSESRSQKWPMYYFLP